MLVKSCSRYRHLLRLTSRHKFWSVTSIQVRNHHIINYKTCDLVHGDDCNHSINIRPLFIRQSIGINLSSLVTSRLASTGRVSAVGGSLSNGSFVIGSKNGSELVTTDLATTTSEHIDGTCLVDSYGQPIFDLASKASQYIPSAAQIELNSWLPTGWVYEYLCFLHHLVPWWAAIGIMTITYRAAIFSIFLDQQRRINDTAHLSDQLKDAKERLAQAKRDGDKDAGNKAAEDVFNVWFEMVPHVLNKLKMVAVQAPIFISTTVALDYMSLYKIPSLTQEGLFWCRNLAMEDPFFLLPIMTACSLHVLVRIVSKFEVGKEKKINIGQYLILYGVPFGVACFMTSFPAAINLYWLVNNLITLLQTYLITRPDVRAKLKLPPKKELQSIRS